MAIAFGALTQDVGFGTTSLTGPTVSGSDTYGLFFIASGTAPSGATWGGSAMTLVQTGSAGFGTQTYSLFVIANPASAATVAATGAGVANNLYAWYYTGVSGVRGSAEAAASSDTASVTNTTVAGDVVAGALYALGNDITVTVGTARGTQQTDAEGGRCRPVDNLASSTSTAITGTLGAITAWGAAAVALQEAGGGGGGSVETVGLAGMGLGFASDSLDVPSFRV